MTGKRSWFKDRKKQTGSVETGDKTGKSKARKIGKIQRDRKKEREETDSRPPSAFIFVPRTQGGN